MARFSADRRYRYQLTRRVGFGDRTVVVFLMLNPSTADEVVNDRTVQALHQLRERLGVRLADRDERLTAPCDRSKRVLLAAGRRAGGGAARERQGTSWRRRR